MSKSPRPAGTQAEIKEAVSKIRRAKALPSAKRMMQAAMVEIARDRKLPVKGISVHLIAGDDQNVGRAHFKGDLGTIEIKIFTDRIELRAIRPNQEPRCEDITDALANKNLPETKQYLMQRIGELRNQA